MASLGAVPTISPLLFSSILTHMKNITPSGAFGLYLGICFFVWIGVYFCYLEVKGMTLEDTRVQIRVWGQVFWTVAREAKNISRTGCKCPIL
jgi:hypothetical protein